MRRDVDAVQIKEPPLRELNRKGSCLKRSCITGCSILLVTLGGLFLLLHYVVSTRSRELKSLPDDFPAIPIYDKTDISTITFTSGHDQAWLIERFALLPKLILSPILLAKAPAEENTHRFTWDNFVDLMKKPVTEERDTYTIEWTDLPAEPGFLEDYYARGLDKAGFAVANRSVSATVRQFSFSTSTVDGSVYIRDVGAPPGTDYTLLTVRVVSQP